MTTVSHPFLWMAAVLLGAGPGPKSVCFSGRGLITAYQAPRKDAQRKGKIWAGRCYPFLGKAVNKWCRGGHVRIGRHAYVCPTGRTRLRSRSPDRAPWPRVRRGRLIPHVYWRLRRHAVVRSGPRMGAAVRRRFHKASILRGRYVKGTWVATTDGFIPRADVKYITPPKLKGVHFTADKRRLPLAWVIRRNAPVRATPNGRVVGRLKRYTVLQVKSVAKAYLKTHRGFVSRRDVRLARVKAPPSGVGRKNERWIHVSHSEWTLVAYEGTRPVFAALIARGPDTPKGLFRLGPKYGVTTLGSGRSGRFIYRLKDVPWAMRVRGKVFMHAAFWHNNFGRHRTHGCVNLSPKDARFLYSWTSPRVPPGWFEVHADPSEPGTRVYITN